MENKDKTVALYKYVKELCALKYRAVTDIKNQHWHYFLNNIPEDTDNINIYFRDRVEEEISGDTVLLSVKKPEFEQCPVPPEDLYEWLEPGWDRYTNETRYKTVLSSDQTVTNSITSMTEVNRFEDSEKRVASYRKWMESRKLWVENQLIINKTRKFFANLFQIYTDIERDSESLELMIGEGIIHVAGNVAINHPILLKRVKFDFDAQSNVISIHDTDTEPEIYTLLLQDMQNINHSSVKQLKENLQENFYHPLDRNESPDYLRLLTHSLCSNSILLSDLNETFQEESLICQLNPVYFVRKKIDGSLKAIDRIIANIEDTGYIPGHLLDLVGGGTIEIPDDNYEQTIDEQLASLSGESVSILLSMEANREQLEIAERIEQYNAVLVQGPPGTGKTHTIANLLGHFLAQGKSVLVTSHTKKALSVLKDKIPNEIKDLCVSVLDDTNIDMVRSVDGISEYLSKFTSSELKKKMESTNRERLGIIKQLADVRKKLFAIRCKEFEPIVFNGESYSTAQAAKFVYEKAEELEYIIPGKVQLYHPLPVQANDLVQLYLSNKAISEIEENELEFDIPDPKLLLTPSEILSIIEQEDRNQVAIKNFGAELGLDLSIDFQNKFISITNQTSTKWFSRNLSVDLLEHLSQFISSFRSLDRWMIYAAIDGRRNGGYRERWSRLIASIIATAAYADSIVANFLGQDISISETIDQSELQLHIKKLTEIFQKKGKVTKLDLLFNKQLEPVLSGVKINNRALNSAKDSQLIDEYLTLIEKRKETALLWNELVASHGLPEFSSLGQSPEHIGLQLIPSVNRYLDWYKNDYTFLNELLDKSGLNKELIFAYSDLDSDIVKTEKALRAVHEIIPHHIAIARCFLDLSANDDRKCQIYNEMILGKRKQSAICVAVADAIQNNNYQVYEQTYYKICDLFPKYLLKKNRLEVLESINKVAPHWAKAIRSRQGIHGETECPKTIEDAWKWKQFVSIIESITSEPFEELQKNAVSISKKLRNITSKVASYSAWFHLVVRTERNIDMKQALHGWKLTVKKIGKGTGKNAPALKRQARELMAKCQVAVPAWIMTVNKALDSLDPSLNSFDIVIIDEASQSDVSSLGILYMAKKVIIVGDDKQVSPMAVGVDIDKMNNLREMHIKEAIPNWHLYDAKTSLYDIASTTFQPLMLREHFRCVPSIIGYSNKLSYDFKIKPLRDASTSKISPPIVKYRVEDGQRDGRQKTNKKEAETVVAFMMACMEQSEYDGMTFGAISLLGDEQAIKIQQVILQKIEPAIIDKRQILCGNASHFQGDERDVVFLSLVDSNEGDGPLSKAGEGADQSRKQRYNVAASRARDQLWVVHSLDYTRDLQNGDLRRDLLEYADNPEAYDQLALAIKAQSDSPFEEAVGKSLVAAGYHIAQQWQVGAYRIDMVVLCKGKKVALECDGDRVHSGDEKIRADMERQAILERIGWRFIRIRGSEYYRNPDNAMNRIYRELNENGIWPENVIEPQDQTDSSELLSRVKIRAAQILDDWLAEKEDEEPNLVPTFPVLKRTFSGFKKDPPMEKTIANTPIVKQLQNQPSGASTIMIPPVQHSKPPVEKPPEKQIIQKIDLIKSTDSIIHDLKKSGVKYIDKRDNGGALWLIGGHELDSLVREYKSKGVIFTFKIGGGKATGHKDAWWTK